MIRLGIVMTTIKSQYDYMYMYMYMYIHVLVVIDMTYTIIHENCEFKALCHYIYSRLLLMSPGMPTL